MCNGGRSVKYFMVYLIICNPGSHICWRGKCSPSIVKWPKAERGTVGWRDAILVRSELCCYECACAWACADACKETELTQMVLGWLFALSHIPSQPVGLSHCYWHPESRCKPPAPCCHREASSIWWVVCGNPLSLLGSVQIRGGIDAPWGDPWPKGDGSQGINIPTGVLANAEHPALWQKEPWLVASMMQIFPPQSISSHQLDVTEHCVSKRCTQKAVPSCDKQASTYTE